MLTSAQPAETSAQAEVPTAMELYPLFFGPDGGLFAGNGFIAHVSIRGKCLLEKTSDEFVSVFGVNPGAVASDGSNTGEAYHAFLQRVRVNIAAIAREAASYDDFAAEVRRFVLATNGPNAELWDDAVKQVRAGERDMEGVRRLPAATEVLVDVEPVGLPAPSLNDPKATQDDFEIAA